MRLPATMDFALSTHWNASRHTSGEAMIEEILGLGFRRVELGYDLRLDLVPGVEEMVRRGAVTVDSVHNFCPVPVGAPRGHPELFTLAATDPRERQGAIQHTARTIQFAASVGARHVVAHAGNVDMDRFSPALFEMATAGEIDTPRFEQLKGRMLDQRDRKAEKQLALLRDSLERLTPVLQESDVTLCLENLPTYESIPTEVEAEHLLRSSGLERVRCWYDIGHAQIRQNLRLINAERWAERLRPYIAGLHIHDVVPPAMDHVMPPNGRVDFARLRRLAEGPVLRVFEPHPQAPAEDVKAGLAFIQAAWAPKAPAPS
jgi:sugar phosphate isomerase/epimerase